MGQLLQVAAAALGDGIGEHGGAVAEESARFHFEPQSLTAAFEEEIEPAAADGDLGTGDAPAAQNTSRLDQVAGDVVRAVRVQEDGFAVAFEADAGPFGTPRGTDDGTSDGELRVGEEHLVHAPRVRQEGFDDLA